MSKLNSSKNDDGGIIYEDAETYEDPYSEPDKDETMPQLFQEETSDKPVHKRTRMSKPKVLVQKQQSQPKPKFKVMTKTEETEIMMKNDSLRKKYDLRNVDEKSINNIWIRARIRQLKERTSSNISNA